MHCTNMYIYRSKPSSLYFIWRKMVQQNLILYIWMVQLYWLFHLVSLLASAFLGSAIVLSACTTLTKYNFDCRSSLWQIYWFLCFFWLVYNVHESPMTSNYSSSSCKPSELIMLSFAKLLFMIHFLVSNITRFLGFFSSLSSSQPICFSFILVLYINLYPRAVTCSSLHIHE